MIGFMAEKLTWQDYRRLNAKKRARKNVVGPVFPVTVTKTAEDGSQVKKTFNQSKADVQRVVLEGELRQRPRRKGA